MSRWAGRRGQIEPLAAIAAVFLVGAGLAVYAGVLDDVAFGADDDRAVADTTLDTVARAVECGGVVDPNRFGVVRERGPAGYRLNATLETAERRWHVGPKATASATNASERVSVQVGAGRVRPGRLVVRVWT
jgi:hypothetical protein